MRPHTLYRLAGSSLTRRNIDVNPLRLCVGKAQANARPREYRSPLVVAVHLNGREARRYSDPHWFPKGSTLVDQTGLSVRQGINAIRTVNGRAFVVLQDGARSGSRDYVAVEMS